MKSEIKELLEKKRYDELIRLAINDRKLINVLISLTYDKQSLICWRAIEAIGLITKEIAKSKPEVVRNLIGRLLWMIRDESGGIGWSSPEMLGEIVKNNPGLFSDIAPIIVSFLEEEKLRAGVLWAVGRIGKVDAKLVEQAVPDIIPFLHDHNNTIRGYAVWALGKYDASKFTNELQELEDDNTNVVIYDDGEFKEMAIGYMAVKIMQKLAKPQIV